MRYLSLSDSSSPFEESVNRLFQKLEPTDHAKHSVAKQQLEKSHFHNLPGISRQKTETISAIRRRETTKKISKERWLSPNGQPDTVSKKPTKICPPASLFVTSQSENLTSQCPPHRHQPRSEQLHNKKILISIILFCTQIFAHCQREMDAVEMNHDEKEVKDFI
ncbi:unnamed protein product [Caenorhabditis nigoni]